jgi:hypothetical protein
MTQTITWEDQKDPICPRCRTYFFLLQLRDYAEFIKSTDGGKADARSVLTCCIGYANASLMLL